ncbi:hypothetical protein M9H77_17964 [Catharanthus roseus]|uniref:Uncharacterized protein n=1 Tax=Catharanthus roseus TaxID=4058 RepID=A0ACC0B656_CATRO|nr:hypothetical protein M9H77_17964 [Catharanthus roseus]
MKTSFGPGLKFVENQVNGRVSGLYCTWLVPRTRGSSDDVDEFLTLRVDPLEEGRSTLRAWPNRTSPSGDSGGDRNYGWPQDRPGRCPRNLEPVLTSDMGVRLFVIERSYDVWLVLTTRYRNLVLMASFWGSALCPWSPTVALRVHLNLGRRSCADISSEQSGAQQATEVLGQDNESVEGQEMAPVALAVTGDMGTFAADSLPHYHHYFGVGSGNMTYVAIVCGASSGLRPLDSRLWS